MSTQETTPEDDARARADLRRKLADLHALATLGVLPPEVDAADEHHRRMLLADAHGYTDDAHFSLVAARRYLARLPWPTTVVAGQPRRRAFPLVSPYDAWTSRMRWNATDGSPLVLAALCGVLVRDVVPCFPPSSWAKITIPGMGAILDAAGVRATFRDAAEGPPHFGLGSVLLDGPWRLDHPQHDPRRKMTSCSHWVALHRAGADLWVYDPFDLAWIPSAVWEAHTLPFVRQKRRVESGAPWRFRGFYDVETDARGVLHTIEPAAPPGRMAG